METQEEFTLNLFGSDEIEIETLSEVLKGTIDSLKALTQESFEQGIFRKFVVKRVDKGSFIVVIASYVQTHPLESTLFAFNAVQAFQAALEIKKHLKGKKPKQVERLGNVVNITNESGSNATVNQFIFDKLATDEEVDKGINRILKAIDNDENRNDLRVDFDDNKGGKTKMEFQKSELKELAKPMDLTPYSNKTHDTFYDGIEVRLGKVDLLGDSKWMIIFGSSKELADIADEKFLIDVKSGIYQFGTSTVMKVKLRIRYFVDEYNQFMLDKKVTYTILEVYNVISNSNSQTNLEIVEDSK